MARILGLDLGSHSVKAILFETSIRAYRTHLVAAVKRAAEGDRGETLRAAVRQLFAEHSLQADQVVVALPSPTLATHVITLPFADPRRIEQTLPFEIEAQLPFDLASVVFDYQLASQQEKKSELLVGVVRKEELSGLLQLLSEVNVDPRIVTHPGIAYQNVLAQLEPAADAPNPVAIVDIGHERISVAIGPPGGPVEFARTFSGGGRDLTRALAAEFQVPLPDAEAWKLDHGALASAVQGGDAERAAGAFVRGLQGVLRELRQTFKAHAGRSRRQVGRVYLCGGTAALRGIEEQLASDLSVPTERLRLPLELATQAPEADHPKLAQAYALALRGHASGAKAPRFNFRRGEFAFKGDFDYARGRIGRLAAFAGALLLLLIVSGIVRNSVLARREQQVDDRLCETTQRVLGACERNYDRALNMMHGTGSPAADVPRLSAVALTAELTQRIPRDVNVTLDQLEVALDRISLRGLADSNKQVDTLTSALRSFRCFKEVAQRR
ncbi:MAG TPA: pilus assembly protein PilM, partial [Myxococcaceae bacterium]|nr:pilus assembly protein PilM [Myxococcaceae bacterium]